VQKIEQAVDTDEHNQQSEPHRLSVGPQLVDDSDIEVGACGAQ